MKLLGISNIFFSFTLFIGSSVAAAEVNVPYEHSANFWFHKCAPNSIDRSACMYFISGIVKGSAGQSALSDTPEFFCTPIGSTNDQAVDIVYGYMTKHPEVRHNDMAVIVFRALADVFPCKK